MHITDVTVELLTQFSKDRGEPDWLLHLRRTAWDNYERLPWPNIKDERWKHTQLDKLNWDHLTYTSNSFQTASSKAELANVPPETSDNSSTLGPSAKAFWDLSRGVYFDVPPPLQEKAIEWISLEAAIKSHPERIQDAWTQSVEAAKSNKFLSLTLALGHIGSCLIIPKGQVIKTPFQSHMFSGENESAKFTINFIFLDEAAEAQIWEELHERDMTAKETNLVSSYTSLVLKENAKVNAYFLQNWNAGTSQFQFQNVTQGGFSNYNAIAVSLGGRVFHNETTLHLQGQGAENRVLGVLFGDEEQNFVNWVTQNHTAQRTTSDIQYRSALKGSSHMFFSGLVSISKEAQQSDAYQSSKSLLLSKDAKAEAIPILEILADDVKCSHGAAVGPVDEDQKYYLQTRGINPEQAEEIIIEGF